MKSVLAFTAAAAVMFGAVWWLRKKVEGKRQRMQNAVDTGRAIGAEL